MHLAQVSQPPTQRWREAAKLKIALALQSLYRGWAVRDHVKSKLENLAVWTLNQYLHFAYYDKSELRLKSLLNGVVVIQRAYRKYMQRRPYIRARIYKPEINTVDWTRILNRKATFDEKMCIWRSVIELRFDVIFICYLSCIWVHTFPLNPLL